jgi:DNA-binding transcriptional MerR regulator
MGRPQDGVVSDDLLAIGAFARLSRLSVKQLRNYADLGLLEPARVDPDTGYRYYRRDQVRDAMAIHLLRGLDVPLATIAATLAGDRTALAAEQARLEARIAAQRRHWEMLDRLLAGPDEPPVGLAREPVHRLRVTRTICGPDDIGAAVGRCVAELPDLVPPLVGIFPVDVAPEMEIAVGYAVPEGPLVLPAGVAAVVTHTGPYEHLPLTYHALFAWIHERGLRPRGTVRETYLTDPTTTEPAGLVTRVAVPLEDET